LRLALVLVLLPCATYGQAVQRQSDEVVNSIAKVKSGDFNVANIEVIAKARAVEAVPALEEQFRRATDVRTKAKIANGLVRLGDKDDIYWNYLLLQATLAVDSDLPDAFSDSNGNAMNQAFSPELIAWAKAHNVTVNAAGLLAVNDLPIKVMLLGQTGDPRAVPLLRRALQSHNSFIVLNAAMGLAQIQDKDSIPLLIDTSRRLPPGLATVVARSLVYFDDPQAQSAVDTYMPKEKATMAREERARGRGVFGW
jgi:hypothetical protein